MIKEKWTTQYPLPIPAHNRLDTKVSQNAKLSRCILSSNIFRIHHRGWSTYTRFAAWVRRMSGLGQDRTAKPNSQDLRSMTDNHIRFTPSLEKAIPFIPLSLYQNTHTHNVDATQLSPDSEPWTTSKPHCLHWSNHMNTYLQLKRDIHTFIPVFPDIKARSWQRVPPLFDLISHQIPVSSLVYNKAFYSHNTPQDHLRKFDCEEFDIGRY